MYSIMWSIAGYRLIPAVRRAPNVSIPYRTWVHRDRGYIQRRDRVSQCFITGVLAQHFVKSRRMENALLYGERLPDQSAPGNRAIYLCPI